MKAWNLFVVLALGGAIVSACSSSSSNGTTSGTNNPFKCATTGSSASDATCGSCMQTSCSAQVTTAFGSDGTGGACASYVSCVNACACTDYACLTKCSPSADCKTAMNATTQCEQSSCGTQCHATSTADAGTDTATTETGAGGCAALAACCPTLPSSAQSGCTSVSTSGNEANCTQTLSGLQQGGYCK